MSLGMCLGGVDASDVVIAHDERGFDELLMAAEAVFVEGVVIEDRP